MKWGQLPIVKKVLLILSFACMLVYLTLEILALLDVWQTHGAVSKMCFGVAWLGLGIVHTKKKLSILYYIAGALWLLMGALYLIK